MDLKKLDIRKEEDFTMFIKKTSGFLLFTIQKIVYSKEEAENLLQDTWLKVNLEINKGRYQTGKSTFSWVMTIARNTAIDHTRKNRISTLPLENQIVAVAGNSEEYCITKDLTEHIYLIMDSILSERDHSIIIDRYVYGFTYPEIAKKMNMPEGTVKSCCFHGIQKIRQKLET